VIAELRVRDLATIEDVALQLGPGLNVLTGETGAGKSLLVDAVSLLLGARGDSGAVRPGATRALVEGAFEPVAALAPLLDELGLEAEDNRLVIRREVSAEGRSRAWVNGSPTTIAALGRLGEALVDLHGQHETQSLLRADAQRDILDAFAGAAPERSEVAARYREMIALAEEERTLAARRDEVRRRADYLRHVVTEIDGSKLVAGEEEQLEVEARRLRHAGARVEQAQRVADLLDGEEGSALRTLRDADRAVTALERIDPDASAWREMLDAAFANLSELARVAADYASGVSQDPARQETVERRRDLLSRLTAKYGGAVAAVLATRGEAAAELDLLDTADVDLRAIAGRRETAAAQWRQAASALSAKRQEAAGRMARAVNRLLPELGLQGGKLEVTLAQLSDPSVAGGESVAFVVRLNQGLEPQPLARTASGGELSRLMLALKVVLARHDEVPTLVFDEVDQGIGGEVATRVAEALGRVAERRQVLVITHLPQIAARADRHLCVSKRARAGIATSDVAVIHGEDRVTELARMLGDPDADTARRHAQALIAASAAGAASARGASTT
jgi:DNA repair protein RecN (Recombination protein N)